MRCPDTTAGDLLCHFFGDTPQETATAILFLALLIAGFLLAIEGIDRVVYARTPLELGVALLVTFAGGALVRIGGFTAY